MGFLSRRERETHLLTKREPLIALGSHQGGGWVGGGGWGWDFISVSAVPHRGDED